MAGYPPGLLAAFVELGGGCKHTPEPWKGCDTCGRPIAEWVKQVGVQVVDVNWQAETIDGQTFDREEILSLDNLPVNLREKVAKIHVQTDDVRMPMVHISVDPRKGWVLHKFKRHMQRVGADVASGLTGASNKLTVLVLEIRERDRPDRFTRLYLHPLAGPILSTEDLYF